MSIKTGKGDLSAIENIEEAWLLPETVAEFMGCNPNTLRAQARQDPSMLGFPVCVMGSRVKIPKDGFIFWYRYGYPKV